VNFVRLDGTDGRLFGWGMGVGKISCWVTCFRFEWTDGRVFGGGLGVGVISCWVSWVIIGWTSGRHFVGGAGRGTDIVLGEWDRLDGSSGRLFGSQLGGERYRAGCVQSVFTGRTSEFLVGSWVWERYRAG
jgi:hypothetical protein